LVLITLAGFVGVALHSPTPLLVGIAGAVAFYFWRWHNAMLLPTNEESVACAKKSNRMLNALALFGIFLQ
jgi:hypothetical protein